MGVQFRVLGPLEVLRDGEPVHPTSAKQRLLLAVLLARRNQTVSVDALVDALWGDNPPTTAPGVLQNYVSRLRKSLEGDLSRAERPRMLVTAPPGYRLEVSSEDLDAARFEQLIAEGRAATADGRPGEAAELLHEALALWRGAAFAGVGDEDPVRTEALRLEELRTLAIEERMEADVRLGRHAELIGELTQLVTDFPLRERFCAQLMLCLYRVGRQADALAAFQELRGRLVDELGLDPSTELVGLERRILSQDPSLDWTPPPADGRSGITTMASRGDGEGPRAATLTFLFTDIEGSTRLLHALGDRFDAILEEHHRLIREAVALQGGEEGETQGDAFLVIFETPTAALAAALAAQRAIEHHAWPDDVALRVRMGLHTGEARRTADNYVGIAIHRAARIATAAHGGQVLVSRATRDLVLGALPEDVSLRALGSRHLKDFDSPEELYQVCHPELPTDFPPPRAAAMRAAASTATGLSLPGDGDSPPFVGRSAELEQLRTWWRNPEDPVRLTLLAGEPGVGKTRLAAELAREVQQEGSVVLYGRATEGGDSAYEPVVGALRQFVLTAPDDEIDALGETGSAALCRLVPEMADRRPEVAARVAAWPEIDRSWLLHAVASCFADPERPRMLLVLDDLQWADRPALLLLSRLIEPRTRLRVLGTFREPDVTPTGHLMDFLADLRRDSRPVQRLALSGLNADDVVELLTALAGAELPLAGRALAAHLQRRANGNSFFIRETLRDLEDTGEISPTEGVWASERPLDELGVAAGVKDVVGQRLSRLATSAREALRAGAVLGQEFDVDILAGVLDVGDAQVIEALEEALAAGILDEDPTHPDRYQFLHTLVREVLLSELTVSRRTRLAWRAGMTLESLRPHELDERAGEIARHFAEGVRVGDASKAVEWSMRAGALALGGLAYEEAVRHYEAAARALERAHETSDEERADVLLELGRASVAAGNPERWRAACLEAAAAARRCGDPERLAQAAITRLGTLGPGEVDVEVVELLEEAAAALRPATSSPSSLRLLAEVLTRLSGYVSDADPVRAAAIAEQALQTARRAADDRVTALALMYSAQVHALEREEQLERFQEAAHLARGIEDREILLTATTNLMLAALLWTDRDEFDRCLAAYERLAERTKAPAYLLLSEIDRAGAAALDGRYSEARERFRDALNRSRELGDPSHVAYIAEGLFPVNRELGRLDADAVRRSVESAPSVPGYRAALAFTLGEMGETGEALALLEELFSDAATVRSGWLRRYNLGMLAEAAATLDERHAAEQLYEWMRDEPRHGDSVIMGPNAYHGSVRRYLGLLALTLDKAGEAVDHHTAALDVHERLRAPGWAARSRYDLARALLARDGKKDDRARAAELIETAMETARSLGMPKLLSEAGLVSVGGSTRRA